MTGTKEQMSVLPSDSNPDGYANPPPPNPSIAQDAATAQEEVKGTDQAASKY